MKQKGEVAYEAYRANACEVPTVLTFPLPPFSELRTPVQEAWAAAEQAVIEALSEPKRPPIPPGAPR
jgi:hypothetical protein